MKAKLVDRPDSRIHFDDDPGLTHQSFKAECDIRNIMSQYKRTGLISHMTSSQAQYGDFSEVPDYQSALNIVIQAQNVFDSLPALLRKRFGNDPAQYLAFVEDVNNRDEMIKLGMIDKVAEQPNSIKTEAPAEADQ